MKVLPTRVDGCFSLQERKHKYRYASFTDPFCILSTCRAILAKGDHILFRDRIFVIATRSIAFAVVVIMCPFIDHSALLHHAGRSCILRVACRDNPSGSQRHPFVGKNGLHGFGHIALAPARAVEHIAARARPFRCLNRIAGRLNPKIPDESPIVA